MLSILLNKISLNISIFVCNSNVCVEMIQNQRVPTFQIFQEFQVLQYIDLKFLKNWVKLK